MITGSVSHELHIILPRNLTTWSYRKFINFTLHFFIASAMNSSSHHLIVATTSSLLYQLGHQSALAFSGAEVLHVACEPNKQFVLILGLREKTTCRPTPFRIWWWWSKRSILMLYKGKPLEEEPRVKWWGDGWLGAARPDSWDVNISFYQAVLVAELLCNVLR